MNDAGATERLYRLLPSIYRIRDVAEGEPLRALMAIMQKQLSLVEANIGDSYENWFIETCDEWVVPYIGSLLSVRTKYPIDADAFSLRPFVANTIGYRRKKGTAAMLEGLARDVTGWAARAVEMFQLLPANQNLDHRRPNAVRNADLRDTSALELIDGPFESTCHFVDVRRISTFGGKYNIPNVALFLWRLQSFQVSVIEKFGGEDVEAGAPAVAEDPLPSARWRFSPLGRDMPLFNANRTVADRRITEADAPGPLRPRAAYDELKAARAAWAAGREMEFRYFSELERVLSVHVAGEPEQIPPEQVQICDLSEWAVGLPSNISLTRDDGETLVTRVAVDPRLGRFAFLDGTTARAVRVTYHHGFSGELGGGFYSRAQEMSAGGPVPIAVRVGDPLARVDSALEDALAAWMTSGGPDAIIEIQDAGVYSAGALEIPAGRSLEIRARDEVRPALALTGAWPIRLNLESTLKLDGLLIKGGSLAIHTNGGLDQDLELRHTTLDPSTSGVRIGGATGGKLSLRLTKSISGPIDFSGGTAGFEGELIAADAIIDARGGEAIKGAERAHLDRVTIFGRSSTEIVEASDVIFGDRLLAGRTQEGCVRFSYVPLGSIAPRMFRCHPSAATASRIIPEWVSRDHGDPGYAQLAFDAPEELAAGGSGGSQIGAFSFLLEPQRRANLRSALDEYLRFGLEAGFFFLT
jgi:hypothetical protein